MRHLLIASLLLSSSAALAEVECSNSSTEFKTKPALVAAFGNVNPYERKWTGPLGVLIAKDASGEKTEIQLTTMAKMGATAMAKTISDPKSKAAVDELLAAANASPELKAPFKFLICVDTDNKPYLDQLGNKQYFNDDRKSVSIAMPGLPAAKFSVAEDTAAAK